MRRQQREGNLAVLTVHPVHPVEAAEERLDEPDPRVEDEVERERNRPGECAEHGGAGQGKRRAREARPERGGPEPEQERDAAQRGNDERPAICSELHLPTITRRLR
jgi:hypothetical protein